MLKMFQALWMVLWNILILHTYLLKDYLPKIVGYKETQKIPWVFSKIAICRTQ